MLHPFEDNSKYTFQKTIAFKSSTNVCTPTEEPNFFFQPLFNKIQGSQGCQKKWKTSRNVNLAVFCAKILLKLSNLEKC